MIISLSDDMFIFFCSGLSPYARKARGEEIGGAALTALILPSDI